MVRRLAHHQRVKFLEFDVHVLFIHELVKPAVRLRDEERLGELLEVVLEQSGDVVRVLLCERRHRAVVPPRLELLDARPLRTDPEESLLTDDCARG